jgi:AAA domain, putative AbiEii toxin, Type IV TA system/AAA ATPase domain
MKLRRLTIHAYRSFLNQTLELDPNVTVIVGRNDTGKTSLLYRFFDQYVWEHGVHSGDRPVVTGDGDRRIGYTLTWDITQADYAEISFPEDFHPPAPHQLDVTFRDTTGSDEQWQFSLDGRLLQAYSHSSLETRCPVLRFSLRNLIPRPHYIAVGSTPSSQFEMHPFKLREGWTRALPHARPSEPESLLLRIGGIDAFVRKPQGRGIEEPWKTPHHVESAGLSLDDVEGRLSRLSHRITEMLHEWWADPPGLTYRIRLAGNDEGKLRQHRMNSYIVISEIVGKTGVPYFGSGLNWFLSFVIELLFLEMNSYPLLLFFDEPGSALHPSAQRAVAKLISSLSRRYQIIYSTHSPFMVDWNFPQRIRLFSRDHETGRTSIENKPYVARGAAQRIWDPLRETLGVSLGDITVVGEQNIFVEGITDQILLANASSKLQASGGPHLDLERVSIVPFSDEDTLGYLLQAAARLGARSTLLVDSDKAGRSMVQKNASQIPGLEVGTYADASGRDSSIEDLIGIDDYLDAVNEAYSGFAWFSQFDCATVRHEIGGLSLGAYLEKAFRERFGRSFSKAFVAVGFVARTDAFDSTALERFARVISDLISRLSVGTVN